MLIKRIPPFFSLPVHTLRFCAMKFMFLVHDRQSEDAVATLSNRLSSTWLNAILALDFVHVAIAVARELGSRPQLLYLRA